MEIQVPLKNKTFMSVTCHNVKGCPGLVIHRTLSSAGVGKDWTVTHVKSKLAVYKGFPSQKKARRFVLDIYPLTDWEQDGEVVIRKMGKDEMNQLQNAARQWLR